MEGPQPFPSCLAAIPPRCPVISLLGLVLATMLVLSTGRAQAYGDPAEGRRLATLWCSGCHQVGPQTKNFANDAVPSFQAVAELPSTTSLSLQAFLRAPHAAMPDLRLTKAQIDDIGADILGLRAQATRQLAADGSCVMIR